MLSSLRRVATRGARHGARRVLPVHQHACFSATAPITVTDTDGEHEIKFLGERAVRTIKAELMAADKNGDGRIDADELQALLKRHKSSFTDREIADIGEMFYAAKAGGSISYDRFIHALDVKLGSEDDAGLDANYHFKATNTKHPLGIGKCSVEYLAGGHSLYTPDELDIKLTHTPPKTLTDKAALASVRLLRFGFDTATRWNVGELTQQKIMLRRRPRRTELPVGSPKF